MKKIVWIVVIVVLLQWIIYENHRYVEAQWGNWKEKALDGAQPEKPGFCFYCSVIKPLIEDGHE